MASLTRLASVVLSGFATIAGLGVSGAANAVVYNAYDDFNGTQGGRTGAWSYGQSAVPDNSLYAGTSTFALIPIVSGMFNGQNGGGAGFPLIGANFMHPGAPDTNWAAAVLRFTAPADGTYSASFQARLTDYNNVAGWNQDWRRDGARMWLNGQYKDLLSPYADLPTYAGHQLQTLNLNLTMVAGQTIDFMIDPDGHRSPGWTARTNLYDSTYFTATVENISAVPEPGTLLMMMTGLGVCGASLLVKRRQLAAQPIG
ncbi:MAG: PEP-CTERM sorting domain-containing protein [Burkholderiales bacterium]|nr:PEP-CTERM sorting domain-containing protein [Burkholderiales bacterium]